MHAIKYNVSIRVALSYWVLPSFGAVGVFQPAGSVETADDSQSRSVARRGQRARIAVGQHLFNRIAVDQQLIRT